MDLSHLYTKKEKNRGENIRKKSLDRNTKDTTQYLEILAPGPFGLKTE